jgi:hypothetical protein
MAQLADAASAGRWAWQRFSMRCCTLVFYVMDSGALQPMLAMNSWQLGIWTGWLAFAIFVPLGLTSNNTSQRWLLAGWKTLQRFVYPAAVLTLLHWIFVHNNLGTGAGPLHSACGTGSLADLEKPVEPPEQPSAA